MSDSSTAVLVTGGTGYAASHLLLHLLTAGYTVRTTVRSLSREASLREALRKGGASDAALARLTFFAVDLLKDDGWADAARGCTFVHHVASPFPSAPPKTDDELVIPAREGTLRVLRAAREAGTVRRVVITGSFAAIGYGHAKTRAEPFTEDDWSILDNPAVPVLAYPKSKTLAERAAWDFATTEPGCPEVVVLNPVGIFGPVLTDQVGTSIQIFTAFLGGDFFMAPKLRLGVVDVRDLADLHVRAMLSPDAAGQRFLAAADGEWLTALQWADIIKKHLLSTGKPATAKKLPSHEAPNFVLKVIGLLDKRVRSLVMELGVVKKTSNDKAKTLLGWKPRPIQQTLTDTVDSLYEHGVVEK